MQREEIDLSIEVQKRMLWWRYFNPPIKWVYWLRRFAGPFSLCLGIYLLFNSDQNWKFVYAVFCICFGIYYLLRPFILMFRQKGISNQKLLISIVDNKLLVEQNGAEHEIELENWGYKIHPRFIELKKEKTSLLIPRDQISESLEDDMLAILTV